MAEETRNGDCKNNYPVTIDIEGCMTRFIAANWR